MFWIIAGFIVLGLAAIGINLAAYRKFYLSGHRAGFEAGRAEGYRSGAIRGHAAGVGQAAHHLDPDHLLSAWRERFESPE